MFRVLAVLLAATFSMVASAQTEPKIDGKSEITQKTVKRDFGSDRFVAGGTVRIVTPVTGDLIAAGGTLDVDAPVGGDAVIAGGTVRVDSAVGASLYAAGGRLVVNGTIGRNARIAGGQVDLAERAVVDGNVSVGGGQVSLLGPVRGYVQAAGGSVFINGPVGGDVTSTAGSLELGPNARIAGRLRYASHEDFRRDPAAQVVGGVERMEIHTRGSPQGTDERSVVGRRGGWGWSIGLMAIAALLAAALPSAATRVSDAVRARWPMSLLLGFIGLVCIPVAALILLLTVIGMPLALLSVALYPALLLFGYVATGVATGTIALQRLQPARASQTAWRVGAAALGMLAVTLLARLPAVGSVVVLLAMLLGTGALLLQVRRPTAT